MPEDFCLFAVSDTICAPAEIDFFVHFCTKNLASDGNNDFPENQLTKFRAV